jgi:hypothetical protein
LNPASTINFLPATPSRATSTGSSNSSTETPVKKRQAVTAAVKTAEEESMDKTNSDATTGEDDLDTLEKPSAVNTALADNAMGGHDANNSTGNLPTEGEDPLLMEEIPLPEQGTSQGTDWGSGTSEDDRTVVKAMKAANAGSEPWSKASGEGDLDVAPNTATTRESTAAVAKDDANVEMTDATTGKYTIHNRLNKRSADLILPSSDTESSSTLNNSLVTTVKAAQPLKTASSANLKALPKISRVTLTRVAEDEGEVFKVNPLPNAASGKTVQAIEPTLDQISPSPQGLTYTRGSGWSGPGASSGSNRGGKRSLRPSTWAAAYNTVAATTKRNYLVHVNRSRDDLEPFRRESEWTTTRDYIKTAIWAEIVKNGVDKDLSVKDWAFHKEKRIGLIFCTSEVKQKRVIQLIIDIGLGAHIVETEHDVTGGIAL